MAIDRSDRRVDPPGYYDDRPAPRPAPGRMLMAESPVRQPSELEKALDRDTQTWQDIAVQFKRYNDLVERRLRLEHPEAFTE